MKKKINFFILGICILSIAILGIILIMITSKGDSENEKDNVYHGSIVESIPTEKLVIPLTEYCILLSAPPGILFDYYEGWEKAQIEVVRGEISLTTKEGHIYSFPTEGNKYEVNKENRKNIYLIPGDELNGYLLEEDKIFYAYITFLEGEHIVAQSLVVIKEDMEVHDAGFIPNYYATPIKEVQYKKIDDKYQNVTEEYADAWFSHNMNEYEIKKAVETVPEKSRFTITEDYSADYKKSSNDEKVYELKGIGIEYKLQNENQYVEASTDNGNVGIWKGSNLKISTNQKIERLSGSSMICWYDSENFERDKYDDRVSYLKLVYKENLKVLGMALIKIEYKDETRTSYTTKVKEVSYEPIDGRSQYISIFTEEAWFERAISEFEQENAI